MSDYLAMKMTESRMDDLRAEVENRRLARELPSRPSLLRRWWDQLTNSDPARQPSARRRYAA
ncbi:hypothetical protein ACF3NT_15355 [Naumannella halotolerans]|uniref:hypothetical protein n=1 Tax=Naumannella halotolerans TaxID=993414 RepID=UPI00370DAA61